jgi:hypothetical protein
MLDAKMAITPINPITNSRKLYGVVLFAIGGGADRGDDIRTLPLI